MPDENYDQEEIMGKAYDIKLFKRLMKYASKYWGLFILAAFLLLASTVADLARPYLIKIAIDNYLSQYSDKPVEYSKPQGSTSGSAAGAPGNNLQQRAGDINSIGIIGMVYIAAIILGFGFNYFQILILSYAGQSIIFNIRQEIFSHLQKMPVAFFDRNPVGKLVTRVTNDTEALNEMYTNVLVSFLKDISIFAGSIALMLALSPVLTLASVLVMPAVIIAALFFRIKAREVYRRVRSALSVLNSALSENISGIRIIQMFKKESENFAEFEKINNRYLRTGLDEIKVFGIFRPAVEMLSSFSVAVLIWYGGRGILDGTIQFGVLFAFVSYISLLFQPINDIAEKFNILQSAMAASERVFGIIDTPAEPDEGSAMGKKKMFKGDIEFKNVSFFYNDGQWVLRDVSFNVSRGQTIAVVGATGSGKTTMISLLNRFYEIQKGQILIDGIDIRNIGKDVLRENIAVVPQDIFLFSGSIKDNIKLNESHITDQRVEEICNYINAGSFIDKLDSGYEHEVAERGVTLSTGQRQLLAFARALVFEPSILVLDEATANIDTETEVLIQDALGKLTENRTTIIIAHRLSTIKHADRILVIHKGSLREMGTHQELLDKKGIYYNLYRLQFAGEG